MEFAAHPQSVTSRGSQGRTLLVLDDDKFSRELIASSAEAAGFTVRTASDPDVFLRLYDAWQPSHVTLDLHLSDRDGVEVIRSLARRHCTSALIIVSGAERRVREAAGRVALDIGLALNGVLPKPFRHLELAELLRSFVRPYRRFPTEPGSSTYAPTTDELRAALIREEFVPYYQPQLDLRTGRIDGFEVLARWAHPTQGLLSPNLFIEQVEREQVAHLLTRSLLRQALGWLSNSGAPPETTLSVNVSADELHAEGAVDDWRLACSEQDVPTSRVMFEITESSALADTPVNLAALARLRIHGFKLAIDDIGMGFSSLGRLMRQPFSALKLDSSFIRELRGSADARKIVRSLLDLGNSLGLRTIAEGVEEPGDLTWLRDSGCQCAQGFLIARPMPAEACEKWLLDGHIGLPHARGKRRAVSNKSIPGVAHER